VRFRIYRNNARVALIEALAANYPVVWRIVGDRQFADIARAFVANRPSRERTLNFYGADFAAFVEAFDPVRAVPYLGDVARLERAVLESRHAAYATPLDPGTIAALGNGVATARLSTHPATRLVAALYPIADIWNAHGEENPQGDAMVFASGAAGALVVRPGFEVMVKALDAAIFAFTEALLAGHDLIGAHAAAAALDAEFDVLAAFRSLLADGAFAGIAAAQQERHGR
jgi:hypothetical protein